MHALKVGPALVYPRERRVFVNGCEQRLGGRAFDLLLALLQAPERVVGREELYETVWADAAVEPNNLAVQMLALRRLLGPGAVVTVPRRGYRLVAPVCPAAAAAEAWPDACDGPALQSAAQWLADRLERERWLTLAGASAPLRLAVARMACDLHGSAGARVLWQPEHPGAPLPGDDLQRRLARTRALLLVPEADTAGRLALAAWLARVRAPSPLRVLALTTVAVRALPGEALLTLPEVAGPQADTASHAAAQPRPFAHHPLRHAERLRAPAKAF